MREREEKQLGDRGVAEGDRNRFVMGRELRPPHPYPLQLFARATLIKQDNLLSYRALPNMASTGYVGLLAFIF